MASVVPKGRVLRQLRAGLLLEHFFDLPDLFFHFAGPVFGFAFRL